MVGPLAHEADPGQTASRDGTGASMLCGFRWILRPLLLAEVCGCVSAWSTEGHSRMNRMAQSLLKGKHRDQVRTMLHGDVVDLSDWEQKTAGPYPHTNLLHWHRQTPEWTCSTGLGIQGKLHCDGKEASLDSILCVVGATFRKYAHDALLLAFPKSHDPLWPLEPGVNWMEVVQQYTTDDHFEKVFASKSTELRWLVTLLGDLHQPLHLLREHDYGRDITIVYQSQEHTLLSFWEDFIPAHLPPGPAQADLDSAYAEHSAAWSQKVPTDLFRDWAREAAEIACRVHQDLEVNHKDGTRTIGPKVELGEKVFLGWLKLAEEMTTRGAQRIAFVLLDLIEHRKHALAQKDGRGRRHRHIRYFHNFGTNLAIAAVLVPGLLAALRWHGRTGGPSLVRLLLRHLKV